MVPTLATGAPCDADQASLYGRAGLSPFMPGGLVAVVSTGRSWQYDIYPPEGSYYKSSVYCPSLRDRFFVSPVFHIIVFEQLPHARSDGCRRARTACAPCTLAHTRAQTHLRHAIAPRAWPPALTGRSFFAAAAPGFVRVDVAVD
jgi:hypothetical protein